MIVDVAAVAVAVAAVALGDEEKERKEKALLEMKTKNIKKGDTRMGCNLHGNRQPLATGETGESIKV